MNPPSSDFARDEEPAYTINEDQDLKPISQMPGFFFLKLIPKQEGENK